MISIRPYSEGDDISDLFNDIYSTRRTKRDWKWQYEDNPQGQSIRMVSLKDDKIIGHNGITPMYINVKGRSKKAGLSLDSIVEKDERGRGIFKDSYLKTLEKAEANGFEMITGFPTIDVIGSLVKKDIDMEDITEIPFFINLYKMDNFLHGIVKIKFLAKILSYPATFLTRFIYREKRIKLKRKYLIKEIKDFNDDFDQLWEKIKKDSQIMTVRSSEFLNWRIKDHPRTDYVTYGAYEKDQLLGYIVLKMEDRKVRKNSKLRVGTIIDLIGLDDDVISSLYLRAKTYFKSEDADFVVLWASPSMKYRQLFIDFGFYKTRSGLPFFLKLLGDNKLKDYIKKEENWYLMPIESDIY